MYFDPRSSRLPIKREVLAKSITAINLSAGLALEGYKVLLIDTDAQANSTRILILDDETGMITDINPFLIKLLGYSWEEFSEKRLWEVGAFKDIEDSINAFQALQKHEYTRYKDLPYHLKNQGQANRAALV